TLFCDGHHIANPTAALVSHTMNGTGALRQFVSAAEALLSCRPFVQPNRPRDRSQCRIALGSTDTGHCVMAFRSYSAILASLLLSSLVAAPAAAVCKSPKNICKHIDECLQRTSDPNNKAAEQIREGVRTRNGRIVWAGAE